MDIFLLIILALASLWDVGTTIYGTTKVLSNGPIQIAAALLFSALILGFVLNTGRIFRWQGFYLGGLLKFFWLVALGYDIFTSWIAHRDLLVRDENYPAQYVILIGLTVLVSASPIVWAVLWERKRQKRVPPNEELRGYS